MRRVGNAPLAPLVAALVFAFWPTEALAWGPLAHLEFGRGALESLGALTAGLRILLQKCWPEFLYGTLAADIVVGKNLARYAVHCHNWRVGFGVLGRARGEPQTAIALGFLAHLASDTVAHNYYVPYKTVQGHSARATGHAYWELRFDQRLDPDLWKLVRFVTRPRFRGYDAFLADALAGSSVMPFTFGRRIFGSLLFAAKRKRWQAVSHVLAAERRQWLADEEIRECRALAVEAVAGVLRHGERAASTAADPTGGRNLAMAAALRRRLRERDDLPARAKADIVRAARPAFRRAIVGPLDLPEIPDRDVVAG